MSARKAFGRARSPQNKFSKRHKVRLRRGRPIGIESLEMRRCWRITIRWPAPDDPLNTHSLRYAVIKANSSAATM